MIRRAALTALLSAAGACGGAPDGEGRSADSGAAAGGSVLAGGTWIDLTHPFDEDAVYWPTADTFRLEEVFRGIEVVGVSSASKDEHATTPGQACGLRLQRPLQHSTADRDHPGYTRQFVSESARPQQLREQVTAVREADDTEGPIAKAGVGGALDRFDRRRYFGVVESPAPADR